MPIYVIGTRQLEQTTACYQEGKKKLEGGFIWGWGWGEGCRSGTGSHTAMTNTSAMSVPLLKNGEGAGKMDKVDSHREQTFQLHYSMEPKD